MLKAASSSCQQAGTRTPVKPSRADFAHYAYWVSFIGLVILFFCDLPMTIASPGWPITRGTVISSEVEAEEFYDHQVGLCPRVSYRYSVADQDYVSRRLGLWTNCYNTESRAESFLKGYPIAAQVQVHYDAENPGHAVLYPGAPDDWSYWPMVAAGFLLLGAGAVFLGAAVLWERSLGRPFYAASHALWRLCQSATSDKK